MRWLPFLFVLLGAATFAAHQDFRTPTRHHVAAQGEFWNAQGADGQPLTQRRGQKGVRLPAGASVSIDNAESEWLEYSAVSFRVRRSDPTAVMQFTFRETPAARGIFLIAPGDPIDAVIAIEYGDGTTNTLKSTQVGGMLADPFEPFRLDFLMKDGRFQCKVNGNTLLVVRDIGLEGGSVALSARDGAVTLERIGIRGLALNQSGIMEPFTSWDDLRGLKPLTRWKGIAFSLGIALVALILMFLWTYSAGPVPLSPLNRASVVALAFSPVSLILCLAWIERSFLEPNAHQEWLELFLWLSSVAGGLLGCRLMAWLAHCEARAASRCSSLFPALACLAILLPLATIAYARAAEAYAVRAHAETTAIELPLPSSITIPLLKLDPSNQLTLEGPYRDVDITGSVFLEEGSAFQLRLRAQQPALTGAFTLVLPADPLRRSTFLREGGSSFRSVGTTGPSCTHRTPLQIHVQVRGREYKAFIDGTLVASAHVDEPTHGALVFLAAPGEISVADLKVVARDPVISGAGWPLSSALIPFLYVLIVSTGFHLLRLAHWRFGLHLSAYALIPMAVVLANPTLTGRISLPDLARVACAGSLLMLAGLIMHVSVGPSARSRWLRLRTATAWLGSITLLTSTVLFTTGRELAPSISSMNDITYTHWHGERLERNLLYLTHPLFRRWNGYLAQHTFRGRTFPLIKPTGTLRILVLGGSSTWGFRLPVNSGSDWPSKLEVLLREQLGGNHVEVMNGAYPGATSNRLYSLLQNSLLSFKPDLVILSLYYNDSFALSRGDEEAYLERVTGPTHDHGFIQEISDTWIAWDSQRKLNRILAAFARHRHSLSTAQVWSKLFGSTVESPDDRFRSILERFARLAEANGFSLVFVQEPMRNAGPWLWKSEFSAAMLDVGKLHGLLTVDPTAQLMKSGGTLFMDEVHPTAAGNQIVAETILPIVIEVLQTER